MMQFENVKSDARLSSVTQKFRYKYYENNATQNNKNKKT